MTNFPKAFPKEFYLVSNNSKTQKYKKYILIEVPPIQNVQMVFLFFLLGYIYEVPIIHFVSRDIKHFGKVYSIHSLPCSKSKNRIFFLCVGEIKLPDEFCEDRFKGLFV